MIDQLLLKHSYSHLHTITTVYTRAIPVSYCMSYISLTTYVGKAGMLN